MISRSINTGRTVALLSALSAFVLLCAFVPTCAAQKTGSQIILLGTGSPVPDPDRSGPAAAILVNGKSYLVDAGAGCVRQAVKAYHDKKIEALRVSNLNIVFITHLHSDHTLGYADLILTPWEERKVPLEVYGPTGTVAMTESLLQAYAEDIQVREEGLQATDPATLKPNVHEIGPGLIYKDSNVTVSAFLVTHGTFPNSFGYKFETPDRTVVFSGDTSPCDVVVEQARGADVLVHEVYAMAKYNEASEETQEYLKSFHTSTEELAQMAGEAQPRLLVPIHMLGYKGLAHGTIEKEIRNAGYEGKIADSKDLNLY